MAAIKQAFVLALGVTLAWAAAPTSALAQGKKSDAVVKIKSEADKPAADGTTAVRLTLTIDPGWHIYANPVGQDDFADNATTVSVSGAGKVEAVKYPEGKPVMDKVLGVYKVYEDKVTITAKVRPATSGGPVELAVKIQACNEAKCLLPATLKVTVP